ncbi:hypothetical protein DDB_G0286827 [Dictyostelium discoideum AX4]|uniref:Uncharacterized protein n=1 Tax=Dictyostelium discoideum TaxID=44689 RepID=Q54L88_DICDI|nr:hypothetical protein DDB_G0286827 [Dictyostelium discoideum AX4]EAL64011.1 hypothetical protein DDB_G0286827 [Dictyostelium discoideum AX4]|eukprot:XP_637515.1 hypothetical protein DDB_G0286827 [Dictyostelium discoideum AX4]
MMKAWVIESYENGFSGLKQKEISILELVTKRKSSFIKNIINFIKLLYNSIILLGEYEPRYKLD